jgi:hypothetical protein
MESTFLRILLLGESGPVRESSPFSVSVALQLQAVVLLMTAMPVRAAAENVR